MKTNVKLQFHKQLDDNSKSVEILVQFLFVIVVFGLVFLACEICERVSTQFEMFGEELARCNWHKLSMEMQRVYVIFLKDTQQPANIDSYGGIQCTRITFKTV